MKQPTDESSVQARAEIQFVFGALDGCSPALLPFRRFYWVKANDIIRRRTSTKTQNRKDDQYDNDCPDDPNDIIHENSL